MKNIEIEKLFNELTDKYALEIVSWASYKFYYNKTEAEDLAQEVMLKLFKAVKSKYLRGEISNLDNLDNYIRKTAKSIFNSYYKDLKARQNLLPEVIDCEDKEENEKANNDLLKRVRTCVINLSKLYREVIIMYYIEQIPTTEIATKLGHSDRYIRKVLEIARHLIKKKEVTLSRTPDFAYRPMKLNMSFSGENHENSDIEKIVSCLSKQNICLACYYFPQDLDEICEKLGLPKTYIEPELEWLIDKGFIVEENNKYSTIFFILDGDFKAKLINIYMNNKKSFIDGVIEKLLSKEKQIKQINFFGSEQPIQKLLWFLIYNFTDRMAKLSGYGDTEKIYDYFVREDSGKYFPIGFYNFKSNVTLNDEFLERYSEIIKWSCDGTYIYEYGENQIKWLGLYTANQLTNDKFADSIIPDFMNYKEIIIRALNPNYNINTASVEEKIVLSRIISNNWLSLVVFNDKIQFEPNFCMFTPEQRRELDNLLTEIYHDLRSEIDNLIEDIKLLCIEVLPKQLNSFSDYIIYLGLLLSNLAVTGGAFYDGKIHIPKDAQECSLLTLNITVSDYVVSDKKKYDILFKIAY